MDSHLDSVRCLMFGQFAAKLSIVTFVIRVHSSRSIRSSLWHPLAIAAKPLSLRFTQHDASSVTRLLQLRPREINDELLICEQLETPF